MEKIKEKIEMSLGEIKCNLVLKNAFYINVFNGQIEQGDIGICDDTIVGIGNYDGEVEIDCSEQYVAPGFIDSHIHIESTMITPEKYSSIAIKNGVTTVIADPHEIANVDGIKGIEFMLKNSENAMIDIYFMLPSCVPATSFEDNGYTLNCEEILELSNHPKVLGLGEVMDIQAVMNKDDEMLCKLKSFNDKPIDGHSPIISPIELNAYIASGVKTDHECSNYKDALNKISKGMYILMREGSAAKNLTSLLKAVKDENYHRFLFCTDDRNIEDLMEEGSIDNCLRIAIREGIDPVKAFTMATFNAAQCYGLKNIGAIAPGYKADLVIFESLKQINIKRVLKNGKDPLLNSKASVIYNIKTSMNVDFVTANDFKVPAIGNEVNVIKVKPQSLETIKEIRKISAENGYVSKINGKDVLKLAIFERHRRSKKYSVGYVEGLGLKDCAIAQTVAHDSHNIIVIGDNDKDMEVAVNSLITIGGGIVIVSEGKLISHLSLPIGGLMTFQEPYIVCENVKRLNRIARSYGIKQDFDPFTTISFLSLPVIPEIKLTTKGLYEFSTESFIDLFI
ncbi:adenine deaminase [Clostridium argentinense CDC 2741]|uniref:Adenine deaminase n=1 Tax=Clostridium argentinense CDC 2741 TaxID=1418104 RepID=A0A0C1U8X0_9CLOT|nr:adenine deaminase [Clostridium argentinense]ARC85150.1 adenine deaminase [Clostridium argentinense]KIE48173.1 adenine deaminase [Clostridium argentinense CDC 2741]NFF39548.1 adenine deaminase [Clostridium argentinense]NFP50905.1 adenine deaminase [Clostridium argentinense]NFP72735.1 adenine deaminase [Clostridium argentinense]